MRKKKVTTLWPLKRTHIWRYPLVGLCGMVVSFETRSVAGVCICVPLHHGCTTLCFQVSVIHHRHLKNGCWADIKWFTHWNWRIIVKMDNWWSIVILKTRLVSHSGVFQMFVNFMLVCGIRGEITLSF